MKSKRYLKKEVQDVLSIIVIILFIMGVSVNDFVNLYGIVQYLLLAGITFMLIVLLAKYGRWSE